METKTFAHVDLKAGDKGEFTAIVATLGVVDAQRDIIRSGAVPDGSAVLVSPFGHATVIHGSPPAGEATLTSHGDRLLADGVLYLDTSIGADVFRVLKRRGVRQEWSLGFVPVQDAVPSPAERAAGAIRILERIEPLEVSPVLRGASPNTQTVGTKHGASSSADMAREYQRFTATAVKHIGRPLLSAKPHLGDAIRFAAKQCAMMPSELPDFRLVTEREMRAVTGDAGPPFGADPTGRYVGWFKSGINVAFVLDDGRSDDELLLTAFHEAAHSFEHRHNWLADEVFAEGEAQRMLAEYHHQTRETPWAPWA